MTNLEGQIQLITVPQEFARLCNAVLSAEYGNDFLPIDDDRPDRGNDGYLKSAKRIFAVHCFKRPQNQSVDKLIRGKMIGDLGKAILLKEEGVWDIDAWTFISNYPVSETVGRTVFLRGSEAGIDVSWRGPAFLAEALQRHAGVREQFPSLQVNEITEHLLEIKESVSGGHDGEATDDVVPDRVPRTQNEQRVLLDARPPGWEFLLFASILLQGRQELEMKWQDHERPPYRRTRRLTDVSEASEFLDDELDVLQAMLRSLIDSFPRDVQEKAFGPMGEAGDPVRIEHFARRILQTYDELLDWSAAFRRVEPPDEVKDVFVIAARLAERPLDELRGFVDVVVEEMDALPERLARGEDDFGTIRLPLNLSTDDQLVEEFNRRMKRARRRLRWGF